MTAFCEHVFQRQTVLHSSVATQSTATFHGSIGLSPTSPFVMMFCFVKAARSTASGRHPFYLVPPEEDIVSCLRWFQFINRIPSPTIPWVLQRHTSPSWLNGGTCRDTTKGHKGWPALWRPHPCKAQPAEPLRGWPVQRGNRPSHLMPPLTADCVSFIYNRQAFEPSPSWRSIGPNTFCVGETL